MAAKIGVLGEGTTATVGTTTIYTVPANKAAKVRLQWYVSAPATTLFSISVNGQVVFQDTAAAAEFSASAAAIATPATSVALAFQVADPIPTAGPPTHVIRPLAVDYYLATGDVVSYTIGTLAATSVRVQVVGVEDDA